VARLLLDHRSGVTVVGAATKNDPDIGRPLHTVVGAARAESPTVVDSLERVLAEHPDVVILATGSFLPDVIDQVLACVRAGVNVISPCEELAYPFVDSPAVAAQIDSAAESGGATVLGTGVNPGFIFDALLGVATGVCWDVQAIRGRRVVDIVGFGENIHRRLGIGYTPEEFDAGHRAGTIAGHVGFPESIGVLCERLGVRLDAAVEETFEPMVATTPAPTKYGAVDAGCTDGFVQRAVGRVDGRDLVKLELVLHLRPREVGFQPADTIEIDGRHPVRLTLDPGMDALLATSAELVNSIPAVLMAPAGLKTIKDLPAATAWLGSVHDVVFR
jgi:4-hydroxy-tetrahydrodipicolinate reductase